MRWPIGRCNILKFVLTSGAVILVEVKDYRVRHRDDGTVTSYTIVPRRLSCAPLSIRIDQIAAVVSCGSTLNFFWRGFDT